MTKRYIKRIVAILFTVLILATSILINLFQPVPQVRAGWFDDIVGGIVDAGSFLYNLINVAVCDTACLPRGDFVQIADNNEKFLDFCKKLSGSDDADYSFDERGLKITGSGGYGGTFGISEKDGNIVLSDELMDLMHDYINDSLESHMPYYYVSGNMTLKEIFYHDEVNLVGLNNAISGKFSDFNMDFMDPNRGQVVDVFYKYKYIVGSRDCDLSNSDDNVGTLAIYNDELYLVQGKFYNSSAVESCPASAHVYSNNSNNEAARIYGVVNSINAQQATCFGLPVKAFRTLEDLKNFLVFGYNSFYGDKWINWNPEENHTTTINKNTFYDTNWDEVYKKMYDSIKKQTDDLQTSIGELPSDEDIREITNNVVGSLDDIIKDATGEITGEIIESTNKQVGLLQKILDKLKEIGDSVSTNFSALLNILQSGTDDKIVVDTTKLENAIKDLKESLLSSNDSMNNDLKTLLQTCQGVLDLLESGEMGNIQVDTTQMQQLLKNILDAINSKEIPEQNTNVVVNVDTDSLKTLLEQILNSVSNLDPNIVVESPSGDVNINLNTNKIENLLEFLGSNLETVKDKIVEMSAVPLNDFLQDIKQQLSTSNTTLEKVLDTVKDIKRINQEQLLYNIVSDLLDVKDQESSDTFIKTIVKVVTPLTTTMSKKFPTSLPWDTLTLVSMLQADAKAPVYNLVIDIPSVNLREEVTIDMQDFELISEVSRTFLSFIWIMLIIILSYKMFGTKD